MNIVIMVTAAILFVGLVAIGWFLDLRQKHNNQTELDNFVVDEIIRLLRIWQKDNEIFCEQMEHDRNNKTPTLNYNMAAHTYRSWLVGEIATVAYLNKVWKPELNSKLKTRIEETFDAQTCEYISNCFSIIYRR